MIANLVHPQQRRDLVSSKISNLWLTKQEFKQAWPASVRGTLVGSILGVLPGGGATLSAFAGYVVEKKLARDPSRFGKGAIEGVAGPESANNAGAQASFIPMLTLGIPGNAVMALMIGALTIHGIQPGPQVMTERPGLFWGMIASMWIGNLMLVVINLPMIGLWVQLLKVPYRQLYLAILLFSAIGVYTVNNNSFEVILTALFGVLGYVFIRLECEPAPLLLGFILGPLMEENLRRAMRISGGDPMIFLNRPISLGLLIAAALLLLVVALPFIRGKRDEVFQEVRCCACGVRPIPKDQTNAGNRENSPCPSPVSRAVISSAPLCIAATASVAAPALAQSTWPDRPVRLVVPVGAGGAADTLARNLSNGFQQFANGQPLIVENRPGGGGTTARRPSRVRSRTATRCSLPRSAPTRSRMCCNRSCCTTRTPRSRRSSTPPICRSLWL